MRLFRRSKDLEATIGSTTRLPDTDIDDGETFYDDYEPSWYVPQDGDNHRFVGEDSLPTLHLITYTDTTGETVLRLCEDSTGLLIGPSDRRLPHAGVYVSQLRGEYYHQDACRAGDFAPGQPVRLVREPHNQFDKNAVAVYDARGEHHAAYVNKQKARMLSKIIDAGENLESISIRGTRAGKACGQIAILAAKPATLARLTEPRPHSLPRPAHLRSPTA